MRPIVFKMFEKIGIFTDSRKQNGSGFLKKRVFVFQSAESEAEFNVQIHPQVIRMTEFAVEKEHTPF